jgi:ferredoxin
MLLNEVKFLGLKFMIIRWLLTVITIIIFSWISAKVIKDEDLPDEVITQSGIIINRNACMGCKLCVKNNPGLFDMQGKKAAVKTYKQSDIDLETLKSTIEACPVQAIQYTKE